MWPQLLPAVDTVQEGIGGENMGHQGKKLAGQKGEARTEHYQQGQGQRAVWLVDGTEFGGLEYSFTSCPGDMPSDSGIPRRNVF